MSQFFEVISGNIAEGVNYQVIGGTSITYNSVIYSPGEIFTGLSGVTNYTKTSGTEIVTEASDLSQISIGYDTGIYTGLFNDAAYISQIATGGETIYYFDAYTEEEFPTEIIEHGYFKIEWQNNKDIDGIRFADGFIDEIYFKSNLEKPEYPITLEGEQDGDGNTNYFFSRYDKRSKLIIPVFEYTADVLASLPLMDIVRLYLNDDEYILMNDVEIEIEAQDNSLQFNATISFNERTIIKRINDNNLT